MYREKFLIVIFIVSQYCPVPSMCVDDYNHQTWRSNHWDLKALRINLDTDKCRNISNQKSIHSPPKKEIIVDPTIYQCFKLYSDENCQGHALQFSQVTEKVVLQLDEHDTTKLRNFNLCPKSYQPCSSSAEEEEDSSKMEAICKKKFSPPLKIDSKLIGIGDQCVSLEMSRTPKIPDYSHSVKLFNHYSRFTHNYHNNYPTCLEFYSERDCGGKSVRLFIEKPGPHEAHPDDDLTLWETNSMVDPDPETYIKSVRKCSCSETHTSPLSQLPLLPEGIPKTTPDLPSSSSPPPPLPKKKSSQQQSLSQTEVIVLCVVGGLAAIMLIIVLILSILLWRKQRRVRQIRNVRVPKRNPPTQERALNVHQVDPIEENDYVNDITGLMSMCRSFATEGYEIPRSSINIGNIRDSTASIIGVGEFSIAFKGTLEPGGRQVAVKTMKSGQATARSMKAALRECQVMMQLGRNHRIVELIGVCTEQVKRGEIYLVMEFCDQGPLKGFLVQHRTKFCNLVKDGEILREDGITASELTKCTIPNGSNGNPLKFNTLQLFKWCCEVADVMEFLATRKIVHVSLTTKNVFLDSNFSTKLADFHWAKVPLEGGAVSSNRANLTKDRSIPWRWFAIESLLDDVFTTQSDIWTFGVFMFELFTLGGTPYPEYSYGSDFTMCIKHGYRLLKPSFATVEIYELMLLCWYDAPDRRPNFSKLKSKLSSMIRDSIRYASNDRLDET